MTLVAAVIVAARNRGAAFATTVHRVASVDAEGSTPDVVTTGRRAGCKRNPAGAMRRQPTGRDDSGDVYLYVFSTSMLYRITGHVHSGDIITIDDGSLMERPVELAEKLTKPDGFGDGVGDGAIFSFSG